MKVTVTGTRGVPGIMGGVETHCEQLCPRLAALGADVTVVRRSSYANDKLTEWNGLSIKDIPTPKKKSLEAIIHTFRALLYAKRTRSDIVHINAVGPALLTPFAKILGMKVVFTHHGFDYDRDKWGTLAKAALRLGERWGCRYADEVIVISDVIRTHVRDAYGRTRGVHLIPNGVPQAEICINQEYFDQLGIQAGKYILGMSRFVPEKRLEDLIRAFRELKKEGSIPQDMKLVLAGDADFEDNYSSSLKEEAAGSGAVLTGFVRGEKLHSLLTNAALYVLPSSHEGLPIALLEAMSYSLPVVVSAIPANLEIGLPEKSYFPVGDIEVLKKRICGVLFSATKPQYDMSRYSWDAIAQSVMDIYESLQQ